MDIEEAVDRMNGLVSFWESRANRAWSDDHKDAIEKCIEELQELIILILKSEKG